MPFNQFILSIGHAGPIEKALAHTLNEQGYHHSHLLIRDIINDQKDLQEMLNDLNEALIAQDLVLLYLDKGYLTANTEAVFPSFLRSLAQAIKMNNTRRLLIIIINCNEEVAKSKPDGIAGILKEYGISFEFIVNPEVQEKHFGKFTIKNKIMDQILAKF